jgi:hypothetical protein
MNKHLSFFFCARVLPSFTKEGGEEFVLENADGEEVDAGEEDTQAGGVEASVGLHEEVGGGSCFCATQLLTGRLFLRPFTVDTEDVIFFPLGNNCRFALQAPSSPPRRLLRL